MARLTETEIAKAFGAGPAEDPPATPVEAAVREIKKLDARMAELAERCREPGQSHEQAYAAMLSENGGVFDKYEEERRAILKRHGVAAGVGA